MTKTNSNISLVIVTANSWRHRHLVNRLAEHFNVLGVVSETKRPLAEGKTEKENKIIAEHSREREAKEKEYFGAEKEFNIADGEVRRVEYQGANKPEIFNWISALKPDYIVLFGSSIIRDPLLSAYKNRIINIHLGLSPYYRGSATTFWPLVEGEPECVGVTVHLAVDKVDAGSILGQARPTIGANDTSHDIGHKNIIAGVELLIRCIKGYAAGAIAPQPQRLEVGKVFKGKDFTAEAVLRMKENFKQGMIKEYLAHKTERDQKYLIIEPK